MITKFHVMRKACLPEDEGRDSYVIGFDTQLAAEIWVKKQEGKYFSSSDYSIVAQIPEKPATVKRWAVGFISFHDNVMTIEIIEAANWQTALNNHTAMIGHYWEAFEHLEEAKKELFDMDCMIDVKEIV